MKTSDKLAHATDLISMANFMQNCAIIRGDTDMFNRYQAIALRLIQYKINLLTPRSK